MENRPLTIEQIGDLCLNSNEWIWIIEEGRGRYYRLSSFDDGILYVTGSGFSFYKKSEYGKSWIAYKNKEIWQYCTLLEKAIKNRRWGLAPQPPSNLKEIEECQLKKR